MEILEAMVSGEVFNIRGRDYIDRVPLARFLSPPGPCPHPGLSVESFAWAGNVWTSKRPNRPGKVWRWCQIRAASTLTWLVFSVNSYHVQLIHHKPTGTNLAVGSLLQTSAHLDQILKTCQLQSHGPLSAWDIYSSKGCSAWRFQKSLVVNACMKNLLKKVVFMNGIPSN